MQLDRASAELRRILSQGKPAESFSEFFFGFFVLVALLALILGLLERWFPEQPRQASALRRPGAAVDFAYWWLGHLCDKITAIAMLLLAFGILLLKVPRLETLVAWQPLPVQALEAFLIGDFIGYWNHRALHEIPWLWRFHAVHHSSTELDWLAGGRVHPVETFLTRIVPFAAIFCLGFSPALGIFFGPVAGLYAIFLHANVRWDYGRFRWILAGPSFHRWHHADDPAAVNRNYAGLFPVWDRLFGTAHFPQHPPGSYGIGRPFPTKLWEQLRSPWRAT